MAVPGRRRPHDLGDESINAVAERAAGDDRTRDAVGVIDDSVAEIVVGEFCRGRRAGAGAVGIDRFLDAVAKNIVREFDAFINAPR